MRDVTTVEYLRQKCLDHIGPSPALTYYDLDRGERVELSHRTTDNWVAKTAHLLVDNGIGPGDRVDVALPLHWQRAVWDLAIWRVGAEVAPTDPAAAEPDDIALLVRGPVANPLDGHVDVIVCSLRPLGLPSDVPLPSGALDYAVEVAGQPDQFSGAPPTSHSAAIATESGSLTHRELVDQSREWAAARAVTHGARLLVADFATPEALPSQVLGEGIGLESYLVAALAHEGSLVMVRGSDGTDLTRLAELERVTVPSHRG